MRAMGIPDWIVATTASTAAPMSSKATVAALDRLRNTEQPHRDLGDDPQGAFRADEQAGEVVAPPPICAPAARSSPCARRP